ncbi:MAG: hypothetical protein Q4G59_05025, partial [Planctomycetia bacterium]|nr:hypothetical protein [Planctomycetia bacterium]
MSDAEDQFEPRQETSGFYPNSSSRSRISVRVSDSSTPDMFASRYETEVRRVGDVLNEQWELVRFIYHGALGEIWEGRDVQRDLRVIIKFIPSDICYYQTELDNIRNLFGQLRGLDHPSINPVYYFGNDPKAGWYFVSGLRNGKKLVKWF